jgi:capsid assembly protease
MTEPQTAAPRSGRYLARVAERVINRPLLLHPQKAEILLWVLGERIGIDADAFRPGPDANRMLGKPKGFVGEDGSIHPFYNLMGNVAVVPVIGSLVNRGAWIGEDSSGFVSYEGLEFQLQAAAQDADAKSIVLDIESPGGEAGGMFALAQTVRAIDRNVKPVHAVVNDMAASAGYGLASAARDITVSPTSIVGSIGVVLVHFDYSQKLEKQGIKPTLIYAGARKVDGNPYAPLSDAVAADLRDEVNAFYNRFLDTVAAGRGDRLSAAAARNTEAGIFLGQHDNPAKDAVKAGLADRVGTLADVLSLLSASPARSRAFSTGAVMTEKSGHQPGADNPGFTQAQLDAAVTAARAEGVTQGKAEGAAAERERLTAILGNDKVKGKAAAALKLAGKMPDASAEDVIEIVADMGAAAPAATIEQRMQGQGTALSLGGPLQKPQGGGEQPKLSATAIYDMRAKACSETPARRG